MSSSLTVLIITYNEEPNIQRVLDKLTWADKVLILDSGSTDKTLEIIKSFPNAEIVFRPFDTFADQCNFGLSLIKTEWTLSLDADYVLSENLGEEIRVAIKEDRYDAFDVSFKFCVYGYPLRANNTTPRIVLFKTQKGKYYNDGHAHRLKVEGNIGHFKNEILHDDRKSLSRWFKNQDTYALQECNKLKNSINIRGIDKIRKLKWLAPFLVFFYCLFIKGLIFNGWYGWYYTLQRTMVEIMFALRLIEAENINTEGVEYKTRC